MSSPDVGRTRKRLADVLSKAITEQRGQTVLVKPDDLHPAQGWYRTSKSYQNEALRWDGWGHINGMNVTIRLISYVPMTDLLRNGIELSKEGACSYEIFAAKPTAGR